ncbi:MAG: haloalkane dehalogenase [Planctomycetota bacterium]|nr:haloalkane dehalogenase [Planctomycetota bacterium]
MNTIRTPEERFAHLPGFPFAPRYTDIRGARLHHVDEGRGEVILCLHGEPTWSYLYRHMIGPLAEHHRVVAPDFLGFGRSDKFTEPDAYTFRMHQETLVAFCDALKLTGITLVGQDWGGLLGLAMLGETPERFSRIVLMNTGAPAGDKPLGPGFMDWLAYVKRTPDLPVGRLVQRSFRRERSKSPEVIAAYEAPFPDARYKVGVQRFPLLVPLEPDDPGAAEMRRAREVLARWTRPALLMFGKEDPVIGVPVGRWFEELIPGAGELRVIEDAGHFLQEDQGELLAQHILEFLGTPLG